MLLILMAVYKKNKKEISMPSWSFNDEGNKQTRLIHL